MVGGETTITQNGFYTVDKSNYVVEDGKGSEFAGEQTGTCSSNMSPAKGISGFYMRNAEEMQCVRDALEKQKVSLPKTDWYLDSLSNVEGAICYNASNVTRNLDILKNMNVVKKCLSDESRSDKDKKSDEARIEAFEKFIDLHTPPAMSIFDYIERGQYGKFAWEVGKYGIGSVLGLGGIFFVFIYPGPDIGNLIRKKYHKDDDNDPKDPPAPPPIGDATRHEKKDNPHPIQPMERFQVEEEYGFWDAARDVGVTALVAGAYIVDNAPKAAAVIGNGAARFGNAAAGAAGAVFSLIPSFAVDPECISTPGCVANGGKGVPEA
ncbi:MAG: hypothetical protein ABH871_00255 [Pseudomonadota bacterium]